MELIAILVSLPFAVSFLVTGVVVNLLQALCYIIVRPLSRKTFRRMNGALSQILWLQILTVMDWFAGFQIQVHADLKIHKLLGKERAIVMSNHISDVDTVIIWHLSQLAGCLGSALFVMKKSAKHLPIYGWAARFSDYIFLDRVWAKDERKLLSSFEALRDFSVPFWLSIFVEGTRLSPDKLLSAREFAASKGQPPPKNVLIPRTKGFVAMVQNMRAFVPAVYDMTICAPRGEPTPSTLRALRGQSSKVKVHIKRYSTEEIPKTDEGIAEWCRERFRAKDALLDHIIPSHATFDDPEIPSFRRSIIPLMVTVLCVALTAMGGWVLCVKYTRGYAVVGTTLGLTMLILHCLIEYTKFPPQRSSPSNLRTTY